jgi:farnesyl-diphosphate farnesyltransferase
VTADVRGDARIIEAPAWTRMTRTDDLLGDLLRQVSRSFYLSLAILPRPLREPIGLAYLLARAADTVADTRLIARAARIGHLQALRRAYAGGSSAVADVARACAPHQTLAAERRLLERVDDVLTAVGSLPSADQARVRGVLRTITDGMLFDLERFPGEDAQGLAALDSLDDLDRYTYLVAGCVGEFWTDLHLAHRARLAGWDAATMRATGVRFGKALQMTNVLRDVPSDLAQGRCYLPARELAALGVKPADLLTPDGAARARPLLSQLLGLALAHYDAAWRYTLAIPRREWRMRLACVWPLLIGQATLEASPPIPTRSPPRPSRSRAPPCVESSPRPRSRSPRIAPSHRRAARRRSRIASHLTAPDLATRHHHD